MPEDTTAPGLRCEGQGQTSDVELLRRYAAEQDEAAFGELVRQRVDLVYSVALRQCGGNAHLAADVTQRVFTDLARKAAALSGRAVLSGWLYRSTRFAASDLVRSERRRGAREAEAQAMNEITNESVRDAEWEKLRPILDEVLSELGEPDRDAVMLRFFEGRAFRDIGAALRLSEDAARMRVDRALEKLRATLARRGVASTTAALGLALAHQGAIAAPAGMAASVTGVALAGAAASATAANGLGVIGTILTMSKINVGIVGLVVVAALVPVALEVRGHQELEAEVRTLRAAGGDLSALRKENRELNVAVAKSAGAGPEAAELARLRARVATLKKRPPGVLDSTLRPVSALNNVGWATPEAALETLLWASEHRQTEEILLHSGWAGDARAPAEAAFEKLSEALRARYGSADRLFAEYCFGSRGPENDALMQANYGKTVSCQILGTAIDSKRGGMRVTWWEQMASGHEREKQDTFCKVGDRYVIGESRWRADLWETMVSEIDPVTLAFRPRKVIPMDPETGRPKR